MLKKCSSLLITMIIIFSMSMTAFADITITTDVKTDSNDNSYTFMVNASDSDNGTLSYQWYECDANGNNPTALSGATGNVYEPKQATETKYYYCEVTSVSEAGTVKSNSKVLEAAYTAEAAKTKEIYTISVEGIAAPVTGETPSSKATSASGGVKITSVSWDPKNSTFQPETIYTATVTVKLDENCEAGSGLKCLIDGNEAAISGDTSSGEFSFYYTFPATEAAAGEDEEAVDGENATVTDMMKDLPAPLGIPGWVWVLIIIVLIIALIAAAIAHSKAKKRERSRHNYMDEIYKEKQAKKDAEEQRRKKAEPIYDEDESDDAEYDEYDADSETEYSEDDYEEEVKVYKRKKDRKASRKSVSRADDNNVSFYEAEDEGFTGQIKTAEPEDSEAEAEFDSQPDSKPDSDADSENNNDKE